MILGYTYTLLESERWDDEQGREMLGIIAASAEKLSVLVNDLVDVAGIAAGVFRLEREPVRVERIVERVLMHRRLLAPEHRLCLEAAPNLSLADADPTRVEQVITNLVENAIKYSPAGSVVAVRISGGAALTVSVRDRGCGVASWEAERIFEPFYRGESGRARGVRGAGLGLSICRRLVEAHGGRIWVEPAPDAGSIFSFTLPALPIREEDEVGPLAQ